jgi:hypothetical protein
MIMTTQAAITGTGPHATSTPSNRRATLAIIGGLGMAWSVFGIVQFVAARKATLASLTADGFTAAQAAAYLALPGWIDVAFAIGVFVGLVGSLALALARRAAVPALGVSLAAYVGLVAGDAYHGLFAVMPAQLAILSVVLAIAAVLLVVAHRALRRGQLH